MDSPATSTSNIDSVFVSLHSTFQKQDNVRDLLRDKRELAEASVRAAQHELITFHTTKDLSVTAGKIKGLLLKTGEGLVNIESVLPEPNAFYRYSDLWSSVRQMISTIAVVIDFVDRNSLADVDRVKQLCGGHDFKLPLEDYLFGVCNAISEFVRLSMNRVIMTDYQTPTRCTVFAIHIFEAFRELNFKNDFLRKRYDGIKYDIKKLEEIVYDLSIRGLISSKKQCNNAHSAVTTEGISKSGTEKGNSATIDGGEAKAKSEAVPQKGPKEDDKKSATDTTE